MLELHGEVAAAAATYFGARAAGATLVGDALATLGALTDESYDYIIHDVFSGGGSAPPLMREAFFRRLKRKLRPEGVAAVNYVGGRGPPLKQASLSRALLGAHVAYFRLVGPAMSFACMCACATQLLVELRQQSKEFSWTSPV